MINFNKNKLINKTLDKYYETFSHTLDTADYVPEKFNNKIHKYIYKNMKKAFRNIDKEDNKYQKDLKQKLKLKTQEEKVTEDKPKNKLTFFFKMLFLRKKRSEIVKDQADYFLEQKINECDSASALDKCTSELNSCNTNPETVSSGFGCPTASEKNNGSRD